MEEAFRVLRGAHFELGERDALDRGGNRCDVHKEGGLVRLRSLRERRLVGCVRLQKQAVEWTGTKSLRRAVARSPHNRAPEGEVES